MLIVQMALILLATKWAGDLSVKAGQPAVLGKLLVGILLGPSVLGLITHTDVLKEISEIGVILLMFLAGLETDLEELKSRSRASFLVGLGGILLPLAAGTWLGQWLGLGWYPSIFLGLLLSATSVSISVQSLREMNRLKTPEGTTILGAAIIDDVVVVLLLAFLMGLAGSGDTSFAQVLGMKAGFFLIAALAAWKLVPWLMRVLSNFRTTEAVTAAAFIICFGFAAFSHAAGVATIIGAYIAGVAVSLTPYRQEVTEKAETISYAFFVPVFFTSIGVTAEFIGIGEHWDIAILLSVVAILTKLIGAGLGARLAGFSRRSALGIGTGMISRGEVALIMASIGLESGLIEPWMFAVMVIVVLATTIVTPPLLKRVFSPRHEEGLS